MWWEAQLARDTEKKAPSARRCGAVQLSKGDKNNFRGIYNRAAYRADRAGLMRHKSNRLGSLRNGAPAVSLRRSAA